MSKYVPKYGDPTAQPMIESQGMIVVTQTKDGTMSCGTYGTGRAREFVDMFQEALLEELRSAGINPVYGED